MNYFVLIFTTLFAAVTLPVDAQFYINGGFECKEGPQTFAGWRNGGGRIDVDSIVKYTGNYSCNYTRDAVTGQPYGVVFCMLNSENTGRLTNKILTLKSKIKYEFDTDTSNFGAIFIQRLHADENGINNKVSHGEIFKGNGEWKESSLDVLIDSVSSTIIVGALVNGRGKIWIDDMTLYANGEQISDSVRISPLNATETDWLQRNSFAFADDEIISVLGNHRIVGLGEETHGSSNIRVLRQMLANRLIEKDSFTIIAEEGRLFCSEEVDDINEYVNSADSTLGKYDSFVQRIKKHNETAAGSVKFVGIEVSPKPLIEKLEKMSNGSLSSETEILKGIMLPESDRYVKEYNGAKNGSVNFTPENRSRVLETNNICKKWANEHISDIQTKETFIFITKLLVEFLDYNYTKRDKLMADVINFVSRRYPDEKILLMAHNQHVRKENQTGVGSHLEKLFNEDYYSLAMTFFEGGYYAREANPSLFNSPFKVFMARTAFPGSYEYMFKTAGKSPLFLPLKGIAKVDGQNDWLFDTMFIRSIGVVKTDNEFTDMNLCGNFDGIIFVNRSIP